MAAGISITIGANDAASGVIAKVNTGLESLNRRAMAARAPMDRMGASLGRFGQITGVERLASDMGGLGRQIGATAAGLGRFAPALGAITGAASVAGLASLVERWTAFGSRLGFDAQRIGMTATSLQGMQGAAQLAGSSAEALTSGMQSLGDNLTNAVAGRSPETVQMLSTLGLSFRDTATGGVRLAKDVLPEIADKISKLTNPAQRAMVATTLLGSAGESLMPLLMRGAGGMAAYNAEAARYGLLNDQGVAAANSMREAQTRLQLAIDGVGYSISEKVAPILVPMLLQFSDWIALHRQDISGFFGDVAQRLREWVDSGGPKRLQEQIERVGKGVQDVVDKVGGWTNAIAIVGGAITLNMLSPLLSVIAVVGRLTTALTIGLVEAFAKAGVAANLFSAGAMKLPIFGALAAAGATLAYFTAKGWAESDQVKDRDAQLRDLDRQRRQGAILTPQDGYGPDGYPVRPQPGDYDYSTPRERTGAGIMLGRGTPAPTTAEQENRGRHAMNTLVGLGWSPEQAAGVVANLHKESGFNPGAVGDGGAAYGIAQWHPDRRAAIERGTGRSLIGASLDDQLRAIDYELRNNERAAGDRLRATRTAADAGAVISRYYERPAAADSEATERGAGASRWMAKLADPVPPVPAMAAPGAQGQPGPDGKATVRLTFDNPPQNMRASTVAQGGLRIETPTLGAVP